MESKKDWYESRRKQRIRRDQYVNTNNDEVPLIPNNIIDQATQRIFITSIFILLQSWKLFDLILMKSEINGDTQLTNLTNFSFVIKYVMLDGAFLWTTSILNIEYLRFSPFVTFLFNICLCIISIFMVSSISLPLFSNVFIPLAKLISQNKELNLIGEKVDRSKVVDMDSHFKGQLVIHYLPDSSAKMNPFHFDQTCLGINNNFEIEMPIEFNTTTSIGRLQIQHTTPDNEVKLIDYSGHTLNKLFKKDYSHLSQYKEYNNNKKDSRVFYLQYPIKNPGSYKIKKVLDKKGNSIKVYKSDFLINYCPGAKFYYPPNFQQTSRFKCISTLFEGDSFPVPWVETYSTTAAQVKIGIKIDGREFQTINLTISQDTDVQKFPKDLSYLKAVKLVRNSLEQKILENPHLFKRDQNTVLEFELLEIKDSFGNSHRYQPLSKDKDVYHKVKLRKSATLGLTDHYKHQEMLIGGEKKISFTEIEQYKDDDFPLNIKISHDQRVITQILKNKDELRKGITVTEPGEYSLFSASDKYCPCEIVPGSKVTVKVAKLPALNISPESVVDKCLGTIGYKFDFNFSGKPPFKVQYHIYSNSSGQLKPVYSESGRAAREIVSHESRHSFQFEPPHEGSYAIVFNTLKDSNYYQTPVKLDEYKHTYSTYFRQASKIGFQSKPTVFICYGEIATIPMLFQGSEPFSFDYEYFDPESHKQLLKTVHVDKVTNYMIETPKELTGKKYEVKLSNARDRFGCDAKIMNNKPVTIISRSDIPEIELASEQNTIKLVEGSHVGIPLKLKSTIGFSRNDILNIKYQAPGSDKQTIHRASLTGSSLKLTEEGTYWLNAYENNGCKGKVSNIEKSVTLAYYERPTMKVITDKEMEQHKDDSIIHLKSVCNGCKNEIVLDIMGEPPFTLDYDIKLPNGKTESNSMNVDKKRIKIDLPTKENGRYEHNFKRIFDKYYSKTNSKHVNSNIPKVIYDVNPLPTAHFIQGKHTTQICENKFIDESIVAQVPLQISGAAPFDIHAIVKNEANGKLQEVTFHNVNEPILMLKNSNFFTLGEYTMRIKEIVDSNGCIGKTFKFNDNYVISITKKPDIVKSDPTTAYYCVGDHISYNISGVAPVTILYEYNGKPRKTESSNVFRRLASKSGTLSIQGLKDSGENPCIVEFAKGSDKYQDLQLYVHDIPSVEVNKGDYIIEDLHEGDQTELIFTFIGEPPFVLTYIRTIDIKQGNRKVRKLLEKHTVEDIWEFEHIVMASLEGTYEAIEIQDKYCRASKSVDYIE